jgi:hypothetical protein
MVKITTFAAYINHHFSWLNSPFWVGSIHRAKLLQVLEAELGEVVEVLMALGRKACGLDLYVSFTVW